MYQQQECYNLSADGQINLTLAGSYHHEE